MQKKNVQDSQEIWLRIKTIHILMLGQKQKFYSFDEQIKNHQPKNKKQILIN